MDLIAFYFLANMLVIIFEQEGYSLSVVSDNAVPDRASRAEPGHSATRRVKRCSCENLRDKECVYYCHIGIVWVNTPRQVVPYGVGSLPVRLKRDAGRCVCAKSSDSGCLHFCRVTHLLKEREGITPSTGMFPSKPKENMSGTPDKWRVNSVSTQKT